jgi:FAD:protein FMN transferase
VVHGDAGEARAALAAALAEVRRVDALMTVYRPDSQVGRLNAQGFLRDPDPHLVRVLEFSRRLWALSGGAFDVTVQPLWRCWAACRGEGRRPTARELGQALALVGSDALEISRGEVRLGRPGMAVTLNGVAQGYAADLALASLAARGVRDALLDTGEHGAEGERQPGDPWALGVRHPRDPGALLGRLRLDGRFVATSGDYATPFSADLADHHVLDPSTGRSPGGLSEVVVAAATGLEADGLTKPMMILPRDRARALLAGFPGAGALWIDKGCRIVDGTGLWLEPLARGRAPRARSS